MSLLQNIDCLIGSQLIADQSVDLVVTDPPYEIKDLKPYYEVILRVLKKSGSVYVFGNIEMIAENWFRDLVIPHKRLLAWYYKNSPKPKGRWRASMQGIIYGYHDGDSSYFNEDAVRVEYLESTKKLNGRVRPSLGRYERYQGSVYDTSKGALPRSVIECPALTGHLSRERIAGHPDQKPIELIKKLISASSRPGEVVLDLFSGTGTVAAAAKELNREYIAFEANQAYYEASKQRLDGVQPSVLQCNQIGKTT